MNEAAERRRTVQFAYDFVEQIATRDNEGNRLRVDWGEPDEHGYWTPAISVDYTDNFAATERKAVVERIRAALGVPFWSVGVSGAYFDMAKVLAILDAEAER